MGSIDDDDTPPFGSNRSGINSFGSGNMDGLRKATKSVRARLEPAGIVRPSSVGTIIDWSLVDSKNHFEHTQGNIFFNIASNSRDRRIQPHRLLYNKIQVRKLL